MADDIFAHFISNYMYYSKNVIQLVTDKHCLNRFHYNVLTVQ